MPIAQVLAVAATLAHEVDASMAADGSLGELSVGSLRSLLTEAVPSLCAEVDGWRGHRCVRPGAVVPVPQPEAPHLRLWQAAGALAGFYSVARRGVVDVAAPYVESSEAFAAVVSRLADVWRVLGPELVARNEGGSNWPAGVPGPSDLAALMTAALRVLVDGARPFRLGLPAEIRRAPERRSRGGAK